MGNEFLKMINTRRSCRKYRKEQITDEELNAILEAGTYAPTGMGQQSPYIVAVQNPEMKAQLERMNAAVRGLSGNPYYNAPTYILVFAPLDCRFAIQDGTCVLENMMLAAHALGVSSCWINREIEMFATEEGKQLMKKMGLPDGLGGIGAISVGYAAVEPAEPKPRKEGYARIIR